MDSSLVMHSAVQLQALPAFSDNYIWMLHDGQKAWVVDPGDAAPVQHALSEKGLELAGILVTHHHADHVGGLAALLPQLHGPIYSPAGEAMPVETQPLFDGDVVQIFGSHFEVMDVPGHTAGHIAFVERGAAAQARAGAAPSTQAPAADAAHAAPILFCGDTLFSGGCGRLFEGTAAQMHHSLGRLAALPANTQVCCTHEYTLSNLRFAMAVEPGNSDLQAYQRACEARRAAGQITLPSSIGLERQINPFLRCTEPAVVARALTEGAASSAPADIFAALREWKNRF
jgi:hydroxyacylglutathione hydrolase